jgi:hypothetical protein
MTEKISNAGKITRAFDFLMLNFTSKDISEEKIDFYSQKLVEEFDADEIERGIVYLIKNRKYSTFPNLAEIREAIIKTYRSEEFAKFIYDNVLFYIRKIGTFRKVIFEDPFINGVIEKMGGWNSIGTLSETELYEKILFEVKEIISSKKKLKEPKLLEEEKKEKYGTVLIKGKTKYWEHNKEKFIENRQPNLLIEEK